MRWPVALLPIMCLGVFFPCMVAASADTVFGQARRSTQSLPESNPSNSSILITAAAGTDQVRFASLGIARRMRLEIVNQAGDRVFDSELREGSLLDWKIDDREGRRLPDGLYGCLVTLEDFTGKLCHRRGVFWVKDGEVRFETPPPDDVKAASQGEVQDMVTVLHSGEVIPTTLLAHDGNAGRIVSGKGGLSFRVGDLFAGKDIELMRLTSDGRLGLGVEEPAARLDVAGLIRTSEGIVFPNGTVQRTAVGPTFAGRGPITEIDMTGPGGKSRPVLCGLTSKDSIRAAQLSAMGGIMDRLNLSEGEANTLFGQDAGASITIGTDLSFFGKSAGNSNSSGFDNSFFGYNAGRWNTTGYQISFFGLGAGYSNTTGTQNAFFGWGSGQGSTTGAGNTFIGYQAGNSNTTENNNAFIGAYSNGAAGITNATAIGHRSSVTGSNSLVLGSIKGVNGADADTNIGIGTTTPASKLDVQGGSYPRIRIKSNSANGGDLALSSATKTWDAYVQGDDLRFWDGADRMTLKAGGGVGIGTISPDAKLDVQGVDYPTIRIKSANGNGGDLVLESSTKRWDAYVQGNDLRFWDGGDRFTLQAGGNVGIGTTNPTERLHVVGNLRVSGAILYRAVEEPIPDYVFEPDYKLMPLEELEKFLTREKHLPNVPPAGQIREKGLDLSAFQMKLLEKIEELALYTVQQAKAIQTQQTAVLAHKVPLERKDAEVRALSARLAFLERMMGPPASGEK